MPVYYPRYPHDRRWNFSKAAASLARITRLTEQLNKIAWLLAYRVEDSELNLSSQNISHKLDGIAMQLENLPTQVEQLLASEKLPDAPAAEEAFKSAKLSEAEESSIAVAPAVDGPRKIRGKRFEACARDGRVFVIYRKRGDLPIWIGLELDFYANANSSSIPVYLNSQAKAERFINGDQV